MECIVAYIIEGLHHPRLHKHHELKHDEMDEKYTNLLSPLTKVGKEVKHVYFRATI